jgi:hypothetical protein
MSQAAQWRPSDSELVTDAVQRNRFACTIVSALISCATDPSTVDGWVGQERVGVTSPGAELLVNSALSQTEFQPDHSYARSGTTWVPVMERYVIQMMNLIIGRDLRTRFEMPDEDDYSVFTPLALLTGKPLFFGDCFEVAWVELPAILVPKSADSFPLHAYGVLKVDVDGEFMIVRDGAGLSCHPAGWRWCDIDGNVTNIDQNFGILRVEEADLSGKTVIGWAQTNVQRPTTFAALSPQERRAMFRPVPYLFDGENSHADDSAPDEVGAPLRKELSGKPIDWVKSNLLTGIAIAVLGTFVWSWISIIRLVRAFDPSSGSKIALPTGLVLAAGLLATTIGTIAASSLGFTVANVQQRALVNRQSVSAKDLGAAISTPTLLAIVSYIGVAIAVFVTWISNEEKSPDVLVAFASSSIGWLVGSASVAFRPMEPNP